MVERKKLLAKSATLLEEKLLSTSIVIFTFQPRKTERHSFVEQIEFRSEWHAVMFLLLYCTLVTSWIKEVEKIMRSNCRQNPIHTFISCVFYFFSFFVQNLQKLSVRSYFLDQNFVFEIQFAVAMDFRLNFLIACGWLLNDPCINAEWISFELFHQIVLVLESPVEIDTDAWEAKII